MAMPCPVLYLDYVKLDSRRYLVLSSVNKLIQRQVDDGMNVLYCIDTLPEFCSEITCSIPEVEQCEFAWRCLASQPDSDSSASSSSGRRA